MTITGPYAGDPVPAEPEQVAWARRMQSDAEACAECLALGYRCADHFDALCILTAAGLPLEP